MELLPPGFQVLIFDLDDTLYKEIDYLTSAYREIARYAAAHCPVDMDSPLWYSHSVI